MKFNSHNLECGDYVLPAGVDEWIKVNHVASEGYYGYTAFGTEYGPEAYCDIKDVRLASEMDYAFN